MKSSAEAPSIAQQSGMGIESITLFAFAGSTKTGAVSRTGSGAVMSGCVFDILTVGARGSGMVTIRAVSFFGPGDAGAGAGGVSTTGVAVGSNIFSSGIAAGVGDFASTRGAGGSAAGTVGGDFTSTIGGGEGAFAMGIGVGGGGGFTSTTGGGGAGVFAIGSGAGVAGFTSPGVGAGGAFATGSDGMGGGFTFIVGTGGGGVFATGTGGGAEGSGASARSSEIEGE
jgi:hypothetical protein